jgi:hypothetical protein
VSEPVLAHYGVIVAGDIAEKRGSREREGGRSPHITVEVCIIFAFLVQTTTDLSLSLTLEVWKSRYSTKHKREQWLDYTGSLPRIWHFPLMRKALLTVSPWSIRVAYEEKQQLSQEVIRFGCVVLLTTIADIYRC